MNNKGQSTTIFIILIPLFFLLGALVVDTGISMYQNKKFKNTTENIIKEVMSNDEYNYGDYETQIKRSYERNKYNNDFLIIESDEYNLHLVNEHSFLTLFSGIIGKKNKVFIELNASKDENNKIIIEYISE